MAKWTRRGALGAVSAIGGMGVGLGLGCGPSGRSESQRSSRADPRAVAEPVPVAMIRGRYAAQWTNEGDGATVRRIFPGPHIRHLDPFVLLDDFDVRHPAGFPMHPHRGFEAFTYMLEGAFFHRDNLGYESRIETGGTQRFTSGSGAWHSEMPASAGRNRGLQLWVNLPRRLKKMPPDYEGIDAKNMPSSADGGVQVREVVGPRSPVILQTEVGYRVCSFPTKGAYEFVIPPGHAGLVYVLEGEVSVHGEVCKEGDVTIPSPGRLPVEAQAGTRLALVHGLPHGEKILHRGPYVD
ncbi:MAG: pirin family protein [Nannocystaceae bacterium]